MTRTQTWYLTILMSRVKTLQESNTTKLLLQYTDITSNPVTQMVSTDTQYYDNTQTSYLIWYSTGGNRHTQYYDSTQIL